MSRSVLRCSIPRACVPLAALLAALPAVCVLGEDAKPPESPAPAPADATPPTKPDALPEMLVKATRIPEEKQTVGTPVTVVTGEDIDQSQAQSLSDALQGTPGLTIKRTGGIGQMTSLLLRGTKPGQTLLLVDGVRVMDSASPSGTPAIDHLMSNDIDRVEVLPGAQSPLYGSDAIGGVVSASTPKGAGPTSGALSVEGGSRGTWSEHLHAGGGDGEFNWYAGVGRYDTHGFSTTTPDSETDSYHNTNAAVRLGWDITDIFGVDVIARAAQATGEYDDTWDATAFVNRPFDVNDPKNNTTLGFLKVAPHLLLADGKWEQVLNLSVFDIMRKDDGLDPSNYPRKATGQNLELDWQNTLHVNKDLDVVGGFDALRQDAKNSGAGSNFTAHTETYAGYAQARWSPVERVSLNGGARVDSYSAFGTQATWRAAAAYESVETNSTLRSSVGTGFKAPTLAQLYDATSYFGSTYNNPNLRPERSLGWDAGIDQRFLGEGKKAQLVLSATYFRNTVTDMIGSDPVTFQNVNIDEARTQGVETAIAWKAMQGDATGTLTVAATYTYTDTENENTQQPLPDHPWNQAALRVDYALPHDAASFGIAARYAGDSKQYDPNLPPFGGVRTAHGRAVVDLVARAKVCPNVSVFGKLENLLNDRTPETLTYNAPPFGAFGGVEVKF